MTDFFPSLSLGSYHENNWSLNAEKRQLQRKWVLAKICIEPNYWLSFLLISCSWKKGKRKIPLPSITGVACSNNLQLIDNLSSRPNELLNRYFAFPQFALSSASQRRTPMRMGMKKHRENDSRDNVFCQPNVSLHVVHVSIYLPSRHAVHANACASQNLISNLLSYANDNGESASCFQLDTHRVGKHKATRYSWPVVQVFFFVYIWIVERRRQRWKIVIKNSSASRGCSLQITQSRKFFFIVIFQNNTQFYSLFENVRRAGQ